MQLVILFAPVVIAATLVLGVVLSFSTTVRSPEEGINGCLLLVVLAIAGFLAGPYLAERAYALFAGPVPYWREGIGWFLLFVGAPPGLALGGCVGMLVIWVVRRIEDSVRGRPQPGVRRPGLKAWWLVSVCVVLGMLTLVALTLTPPTTRP